MQYIYPAIFTKEEHESLGTVYNVEFPDLLGCLTFGKSIPEAIKMAREALAGCIGAMQDRNETIPDATPFNSVQCNDGFVKLIELDR